MRQSVVHILATCERLALLANTLLVFATLRRGFPRARVVVHVKGMDHLGVGPLAEQAVRRAAAGCGGEVCGAARELRHDDWLEGLMLGEPGAFWVVDTDMVFWRSVEDLADGETTLMGRLEPGWIDPWTNTERVARLHTCCLYVDGGRVRGAMSRWLRELPAGLPLSPVAHFVQEHFVPRLGKRTLCYDTGAGLYQAIGGRAFTAEENGAFEHLNCGTYVDAASPAIGDGKSLAAVHRAVWQEVGRAKGLWEVQQAFYRERSPERVG